MDKQGALNFPYEFKELEPDDKAAITKLYDAPKDFIEVGPKKYKVLRPFVQDAVNLYNMPVRKSDIFVATFQRSGTTLTQELVWLIANNLDYDTAAAITLSKRYHFIDMFMYFNEEWKRSFVDGMEDKKTARMIVESIATPISEKIKSIPSPRFIKTHLPMSLLPPSLIDTAKVVYVARDPRDVAVSCYHHCRLFKVLECRNPFKDFWKLFIKDLSMLTPIFEHIKEAWELRHHPNMLFLFYEELSKDLPVTLRRVAEFLGKELTSEQISRLCDHLSFDKFKNNQSVNYEDIRVYGILSSDEVFVRKGKVGGWRDYFDEEMKLEAEQWFADNLSDTDLRFPSK